MDEARKLKILVINQAPLDRYYEMYCRGEFPGHHLYGVLELRSKHNMKVIVPSHTKYKFLNRIGKWFDIDLLDQQVRALFALKNADMLYAPYAVANTKFIVLCKLFGIVRKPVVILVHFALFGKPSKYKWKRALVRKLIMQYDTLLFFSAKMREDLVTTYNIDREHARRHFRLTSWGPDMDFFKKFLTDKEPSEMPFAISSGTTYRDFNTLVTAFSRINFPLKLYCTPGSYPTVPIPSNVEVLSGKFPFEQICHDCANARLILIPLAPSPEGNMGFTSLIDAMGLHKPVIMTKNPNVDVDFEIENIGIAVEESSPEAIVDAVNSLLHDYPRLKEMGENCARLGDTRLNIKNFADSLAEALRITHENYQLKKERTIFQRFIYYLRSLV